MASFRSNSAKGPLLSTHALAHEHARMSTLAASRTCHGAAPNLASPLVATIITPKDSTRLSPPPQ
eukprot:6183700-Pleurochrysis_carterae.AAC.1